MISEARAIVEELRPHLPDHMSQQDVINTIYSILLIVGRIEHVKTKIERCNKLAKEKPELFLKLLDVKEDYSPAPKAMLVPFIVKEFGISKAVAYRLCNTCIALRGVIR